MDNNKLQEIKRRYNIVGNCDALNYSLDVALQVAPTDLSVLVVGESGVGKEVIPKLIHDNSPRRREKYFAVNCGSIPQGTIDSELFGHEKGSFTGAIGESEGYFGVANKGTIFLDEVGELPMATQARLLRVLETGEYIRVGGQQIMKTDVRIVAATNVNIRQAISEGRFREDLYYRLSTIPIKIPALRERGDDIVLLFRLFALQMAEKYHMPAITLNAEAKRILVNYKWPGNVRQLKNVTEQMSVLSPSREIDAEIMKRFIPDDRESTQLARLDPSSDRSFANEREMIYQILFDMKANVDTLKAEMKTLRNQLDEQRSLAGLAGFDTPTEESSFKLGDTADKPADSSRLPSRMAPADSSRVFTEAEEVSEFQTTNLKDMNREMLVKVLEKNGGNRRKTAEQLGISDRTLYRRLSEFGIK
ncbi:MAG: sigma-54 dependent transcriptional regulator [Prevotella sp.]|nr:sigma-54 dependent transcriptional regulator [Prevotella sp.]